MHVTTSFDVLNEVITHSEAIEHKCSLNPVMGRWAVCPRTFLWEQRMKRNFTERWNEQLSVSTGKLEKWCTFKNCDLRAISYECICSPVWCVLTRNRAWNVSSLCHLYECFATSINFLAHRCGLITQSANTIECSRWCSIHSNLQWLCTFSAVPGNFWSFFWLEISGKRTKAINWGHRETGYHR